MTKKTESILADAGVELSEAERAAARKQGAIEAEREAGKSTYQSLVDSDVTGVAEKKQYLGSDEIMQWEPLLNLGVDEFEARINETKEGFVPEEKAFGLLKLERNGQNRTPYVKAIMKRLGLKAEDLPAGGPGYTNDLTPISEL